jgi:uncharacterized lipoprotein YmbA
VSVLEKDTIDAIGIDALTSDVVLSISDHLDWSSPLEHLHVLQDKLNTYLAFVESGEMFESYPSSRGCNVVFQIVAQHQGGSEAEAFIERIRPILSEAGISLRMTDLDRLNAARPS